MNVSVVVGLVIGLEGLSQASRVLLKVFGRMAVGSTPHKEERFMALITLGPSYVVTTIVAAVTGFRGAFHFIGLLNAPAGVQMTGTRFGGDMEPAWVMACAGVEQTNYIFSAYLVQDLVHLIIQYPKLGGLEQLLHHSVFILCCFISGGYQINHFPFAWLILGELSTVLLEARWFLRQMDMGHGALMDFVNMSFAATFGVTRVLVYGWGLVKMLVSNNVIWEDPGATGLSKTLVMINLVLVVLGYGLNLFWFQKIVAMALRGSKKKEDKVGKEEKAH